MKEEINDKKKSNKKKSPYPVTVGAAALKLQEDRGLGENPIELQREIHRGTNSKKSYEEEIWEAVDRGCRDPEILGNFYIVVLFKKERHLQNVVRQMFFYRQSCPTPEYDQTVYRYIRDGDEIEFLWTVPNNAACQFLPKMKDLPDDHKILLFMIQAFKNGDLDRMASRYDEEFIAI